MVRINLLPSEIVERRRYEGVYPYVFIVGGVALAVVLIVWMGLQWSVAQRTEQVQRSQEIVNGMNKQARSLAVFEEQRIALSERQGTVVRSLAGRVDMGRLMEEISLVLPDPLFLRSLRLDQEAGAVMEGETPAVSDTKLTEGFKSIAWGLVRLNSLESLYDVWLVTANKTAGSTGTGTSAGTLPSVVFNITAKIVKPSADQTVSAPPATTGQ